MTDRSRLRLVVVRVLVLSLLLTLLSRVWYMQVMASEQYLAAAEYNQTRQVLTLPTRGLILDDMGRPLVQNSTALVVSVDRNGLPKAKSKERYQRPQPAVVVDRNAVQPAGLHDRIVRLLQGPRRRTSGGGRETRTAGTVRRSSRSRW